MLLLLMIVAACVYGFIVAAAPGSAMQNALDLALLGGLAVITLGQAVSVAARAVLMLRHVARAPAPQQPQLPAAADLRPTRIMQLHTATGGAQIGAGAASLAQQLSPPPSDAAVSAASRGTRALFAALLCVSVGAGLLLLSVGWSNLYRSDYQSWTLLFTAAEAAALALLLYAAHLADAAQRERVQIVADVALLATHPGAALAKELSGGSGGSMTGSRSGSRKNKSASGSNRSSIIAAPRIHGSPAAGSVQASTRGSGSGLSPPLSPNFVAANTDADTTATSTSADGAAAPVVLLHYGAGGLVAAAATPPSVPAGGLAPLRLSATPAAMFARMRRQMSQRADPAAAAAGAGPQSPARKQLSLRLAGRVTLPTSAAPVAVATSPLSATSSRSDRVGRIVRGLHDEDDEEAQGAVSAAESLALPYPALSLAEGLPGAMDTDQASD